MTLAAVQGQARAVEALRRALAEATLAHAYLFTGPSGVGKELTALGLAQALVCSEAPGKGCGRCSACLRVERFRHPDVLWLMPESEQVRRKLAGRSDFDHVPSREIRVEQVRRLQERLALRGLESRSKPVLVLPAEAMNPQAQNAFLKTLEEPPADTTLLLVSAAPDRLLPTLRSRCVRISFAPLPRALVAERVMRDRGLERDAAEAVATLADGSLERALALDAAGLERRRETIRAFEAVTSADLRTALRFAEQAGGSREEAEQALAVLATWVRDVAVARAGGAGLFHPELRALAEEAAGRLDDILLHLRFRLLDEALVAIRQHNASPRLQLERLALEMAGPAA
ncbi:MAG TPA: DNA polymerase III subunit delta' [Myxococcaceae bacterium]|nr:DNA polymerase III subunit delta' [Myxococcaceae bacterium]